MITIRIPVSGILFNHLVSEVYVPAKHLDLVVETFFFFLYYFISNAPTQTMDTQKQTQVINRIMDTINENYVFADVAKKMGEYLLKKLKKGAYKKISDPGEFAQVLTKDLLDICHDIHLSVDYYAEPPQQRPGAPRGPEKLRRQWGYFNFQFETVQRLAGNVGYLKLNNFMAAEYGGATAVAGWLGSGNLFPG